MQQKGEIVNAIHPLILALEAGSPSKTHGLLSRTKAALAEVTDLFEYM